MPGRLVGNRWRRLAADNTHVEAMRRPKRRIRGGPQRHLERAQYDGATGLYYLNDRYYDPATSRFIFEDPAASDYFNPPVGRWSHQLPSVTARNPILFNFYAYAANDPVNNYDPSGDGDGHGNAPSKVVECLSEATEEWKDREENYALMEELSAANSEEVSAFVATELSEEVAVVVEVEVEVVTAEIIL